MSHRLRLDEYETCVECGAGLESVWRDGVHWFAEEGDNDG